MIKFLDLHKINTQYEQELKENKKEQDPSVNASQEVINQWRG